ncbi:MAG: SpoVA/SpoVAEb family sporulation membrane protein [Clostridia bacterium]|nr:SpoVA/SpoVAEb family sporulation membrane protein [Clostridia bacterium]MBR3865478.1 SpoVA/SpoVAEb family sporulation membrane protein [Clostridia bacterium]
MKMSPEEYRKTYKKASPASPSAKTLPRAFLAGGAICALGQAFIELYTSNGISEKNAAALTSCTLITIGVLLTAFRIFEKLAKWAGAGTLVPITGFANAIASPAIEFRDEGRVLGTCVKMFTIAGPVLTFGITASVIYGIIYWALM